MKGVFQEKSAGGGSGVAAVSGGSERFAHISFTGSPRPCPRLQPPAGLSLSKLVARRTVEPSLRPSRNVVSENSEESAFVEGIVARMGLSCGEYRLSPMIRRVPACLRALRVSSLADARDRLARDPGLIPRALDALLIGTTEFFRDRTVFDTLRDSVIPAMLERKAHPRVWSAACSEGAELYSVAMTFAIFGSLREGQFFGTDFRQSAVEHARQGIFARPSLRGVCEPQCSLFVTTGHDTISISPEIRRAIRWQTGDVLADDPGGPWDMILCRNLAIYLSPLAASGLWERLSASLAPGGILVVGKAEKPVAPGLRKIHPFIYCKHSIP